MRCCSPTSGPAAAVSAGRVSWPRGPASRRSCCCAAARRQAYARAVWRTSHAGRETQRFGDAFIRGYRCIRRLATGATTDLYVGESESAGALVALKVARDRQDEQAQPFDAFGRFLQEYEIAQRIDSAAVVRLYDLG